MVKEADLATILFLDEQSSTLQEMTADPESGIAGELGEPYINDTDFEGITTADIVEWF